MSKRRRDVKKPHSFVPTTWTKKATNLLKVDPAESNEMVESYLYSLTLDYEKEVAWREDRLKEIDWEKKERIKKAENETFQMRKRIRLERLIEETKASEKTPEETKKKWIATWTAQLNGEDDSEDDDSKDEKDKKDEKKEKLSEEEKKKREQWLNRFVSWRSSKFKERAKGHVAKFNRLRTVWKMPEPRPWKVVDQDKVNAGEGCVVDWLTFNRWMALVDTERGWAINRWYRYPVPFRLYDIEDNDLVVCYHRVPHGFKWNVIRPNEIGRQVIIGHNKTSLPKSYMWRKSVEPPLNWKVAYY